MSESATQLNALRDMFASAAMTGLLSHEKRLNFTEDRLATMAYQQADAMLAERRKFTEATE